MTTSSVKSASPPPPEYIAPPVTVTLTLILLVFFFVGFFSLYFCRCFVQNLIYTWHLRHSPNGTPEEGPASNDSRGLDKLIIQSFPSFTYSTVKGCRKEKYGLECAVCLDEFSDNDVLRLVILCSHVFHQECIDLWFESHKTCPVCRRNLDSPTQSPMKSPLSIYSNSVNDIEHENEQVDSFHITIEEDKGDRTLDSTAAHERIDPPPLNEVDKFSRSHSTGHSIVRMKEEEEDKFTLRLPEHVKTRLIKGHSSSRSWTTYGEYKTKDKRGNSNLGEASGLSSFGDINKV
ncbi:RING-H2 finger ATL29-like [Olea europaea subsp. europaea]|uniref:RING-type E3 ubiquitin transferase n=1 Tax=Olea europaea subsp. europaea TaxID=158383 RepID=A0A8S0UCG9_OLEEU|nr:RING-H2 finger ATL29-like [Olea europaea subsp. europaea]